MHFSSWLGIKNLDSKIHFTVVKLATLDFEESPLIFLMFFKVCHVVQIFALWAVGLHLKCEMCYAMTSVFQKQSNLKFIWIKYF